MRKYIIALMLFINFSFSFALVVETNDHLYDVKQLTDEGYLVYDKLTMDGAKVYCNAVTINPFKIVDQDEYEYLEGRNPLETSTYWKNTTIIAWLNDHGVTNDLTSYTKEYLQDIVRQILSQYLE